MARSILGSYETVEEKRKAFNTSEIENIYYKDIKPAKRNRVLRFIEELASDIREDGLDHNIVLRKIDDPDYRFEIIAGHRRYAAIKLNIEKYHDTTYEYIPSKIHDYDDIDALRRLHLNNINNRGYNTGEMMNAIEDLENIYKVKKHEDKIPGRVVSLIENDIALHKSQISNYLKVIHDGIPEIRKLLENEEITLNNAMDLCSLDQEKQIEFINSVENINSDTIDEYISAIHYRNDKEASKHEVQEEPEIEEYTIVEDESTSKEQQYHEYTENDIIKTLDVIQNNLYKIIDGIDENTELEKIIIATDANNHPIYIQEIINKVFLKYITMCKQSIQKYKEE